MIVSRMKKRLSLPRHTTGASEVNDCVKINHCKPGLKQYHAAVFFWVPSPHPTKRSQYDDVYITPAPQCAYLAIAVSFTGHHVQ